MSRLRRSRDHGLEILGPALLFSELVLAGLHLALTMIGFRNLYKAGRAPGQVPICWLLR